MSSLALSNIVLHISRWTIWLYNINIRIWWPTMFISRDDWLDKQKAQCASPLFIFCLMSREHTPVIHPRYSLYAYPKCRCHERRVHCIAISLFWSVLTLLQYAYQFSPNWKCLVFMGIYNVISWERHFFSLFILCLCAICEWIPLYFFF